MNIDELKKFLLGQSTMALEEFQKNKQRIAQLIYAKSELKIQLMNLEKRNIALETINQSCIDIHKKIDEETKQ